MDSETFKTLNKENGDYGCYRYLDVSTAHVSMKDMAKMMEKQGPQDSHVLGVYDCGVILAIGEGEAEHDPDFSEACNDLIDYALKSGCCLIRIDADGMEFPNFPTFDW